MDTFLYENSAKPQKHEESLEVALDAIMINETNLPSATKYKALIVPEFLEFKSKSHQE